MNLLERPLARAERHRPARLLYRLLLVALLAGCSQTPLANDDERPTPGDAQQVALCHKQANESFALIEDARDSFAAHLLHGDGVPSGAVPGRAGSVFTSTCTFAADTGEGSCPTGMARLGTFCIDRWEGRLQDHAPYDVPLAGIAQTAPLVVPQAYISADVAEAACQAVGKRLCTSPEWLRACRGPAPHETAFPYGDAYVPGACNEGREVHPVIELFGGNADWSALQMNDPRLNQLPNSLALTGSRAACMTPEGVFDLHGNLHEWVADSEGTFRGGFYVDAEINGRGCSYRTTAHGRSYHDYSTGFRCCTDTR